MLRSLCTIIKQCVVGGVYLLSCFIVYCGSPPGVNSIHQAHHTGVEATFRQLYSGESKIFLYWLTGTQKMVGKARVLISKDYFALENSMR